MDGLNMENAILAQLRFGIDDIAKQMELIEQMARQAALKAQEAFKNTSLVSPVAMQAITQGEAQKVAAVTKGEAQISAIQTKEALARQQVAQKEASTRLAIVRQQVEQEKLLYMQARRTTFEDKPTGLLGLTMRHASWFATGAALWSTFGLMKEAVVEVEKGMKGLITVLPELHESQEAYNEASKQSIDLMQKFGADLDEVMQSARSFGRMYKDTETVMGLTHNAILLNVIDMVKLEDAVKGNEAALSVYGKELKSTNEILAFSGKLMDSLTRLSHESMAQASDLIIILQQSAAAAKQAGVSMDELLGLGASSVRATGLQGQGGQLGRMLRTAFVQLSAPTQAVEKDIEAIGVKMRDANGVLRSAYDIILDLSLATKDATISQEELNNAILRASSGKFQYSRLAALVGQFDEIVVNTARSINSQGQTMMMAAQQLDTIERKAKMLRATLIDLFSGAGDSGLREVLKDLIDTIDQFIMGLTKVSASVINSGLVIGGAILAWKALSAVFAALVPVMASVIGTEAIMTGTMKAMAAGAISATVGAGMLNASMGKLAATTAIATAGISLLVGGLVYLIYRAGQAQKAELELTQSIKDNTVAHQQQLRQYEQTVEFLETMAQHHERLTAKLATLKQGTAEYNAVNKDLQAVKKAIITVTDDETKATLGISDAKDGEKKVNGELISRLIELQKQHTATTKKLLEEDVKLTEQAITNAGKRVKAISVEIEALKALAGQYGKDAKPQTLHFGKWDTGIPIKNPLSGFVEKNINSEIAKQEKELKQAQSNVLKLENDMQNLLLELGQVDLNVEHEPPGLDADKKSKKDLIKQGLDELGFASKQAEMANAIMESALSRLSDQLNNVSAEYDYLSNRIEAGAATSADYARMQELIGIKMGLVENEQVKLTEANIRYQRQINTLNPLLAKATAEYERFKATGDFEHMKDAQSAVKDLQGEIDSLSGAIASNTQKIWDNKGALEQLATTAYSGYYQSMMNWMQHMEATGRMTAELQTGVLEGFDKQKMGLQDIRDLEKRQFNDRLDRLQAERDKIKDAYDERMRQFENEIEANDRLIESKEKQAEAAVNAVDDEIKAIQRLMDLLDDDAESEDREEAERQHNKKLAELEEERLYHQFRTGLEHQDRIKEIDDETAEENRRWQLQQNDWARKDQKQAYQDQIDALKDKQKAIDKSAREEINQIKTQNDRKKQEMQKFYNELENILNDSTLRMLAASDSSGNQFIERMREVARQATQAFKGELKFDRVIDSALGLQNDAQDAYDGLPSGSNAGMPSAPGPQQSLVATVSPNQVKNIGGTYALPSRTLAGLLGESVEWNQQKQQVNIGGSWFSPLLNDNGTTYLGVRQVAEALGYIVKYVGSNDSIQIWDKAHDGAKVLSTGAAILKHDERVLSPNLAASVDRLFSVLVKTPDVTSRITGGGFADLDRVADRVIAAMERRRLLVDKAVNIEHVSFEDKADMQALGIEVRSMLTATG